jgi:peptidoglycan/xylan/chitin deacetylase (PgdA/CDA1 family)
MRGEAGEQMGKISILMYHQVGEFSRPATHRANYCHIRRFKAQMAWLHRFGYRVIGLEDAYEVLFGGRSLAGNAVVLTFDDGYQNFYEFAFPVLKQYGFPATVFLVADLLGRKTEWLAAEKREAALMDLATVRKLRREGILFGSHTLSHPRLSAIDREWMRREVQASRRQLEILLEEEIGFFCYPYGDFDDEVVAAVREAGYKAALSCNRASSYGHEDPFKLPRKAISYGDSLAGFFWKLHMKNRPKREY